MMTATRKSRKARLSSLEGASPRYVKGAMALCGVLFHIGASKNKQKYRNHWAFAMVRP
jgi:hypothetical protein